jgi:hypothetical protein
MVRPIRPFHKDLLAFDLTAHHKVCHAFGFAAFAFKVCLVVFVLSVRPGEVPMAHLDGEVSLEGWSRQMDYEVNVERWRLAISWSRG